MGRSRHGISLLICGLLVMFAVGAKLAGYRPFEKNAQAFGSTKACKSTDSTTISTEQAEQAAVHPETLAPAVQLTVTPAPRFEPTDSVPVQARWPVSPPLGVRPPPAV